MRGNNPILRLSGQENIQFMKYFLNWSITLRLVTGKKLVHSLSLVGNCSNRFSASCKSRMFRPGLSFYCVEQSVHPPPNASLQRLDSRL